MWSAIYLYYLRSRNEEIAPVSGSELDIIESFAWIEGAISSGPLAKQTMRQVEKQERQGVNRSVR